MQVTSGTYLRSDIEGKGLSSTNCLSAGLTSDPAVLDESRVGGSIAAFEHPSIQESYQNYLRTLHDGFVVLIEFWTARHNLNYTNPKPNCVAGIIQGKATVAVSPRAARSR